MGSPIFSINLTIENDSIPAIKSKLSYVHMSIKKSQAILQSFTTLRAEVSLLHGQSFQLLICRVVGLFFIRLRFNTIRSAQREIIIQNIFSFSENKKHLFTCKAATGIGEKVTYFKLVDYAQRKEQVIVRTAICKFVTQMQTPFVNQSAPHERARYQNDNCRRSFSFRDVLIFRGVRGRLSSCGLGMFQIRTMANFETEVYELLKLFYSSRRS